jgi:hypothetical protein
MQETFASTFRNADSPVQKIFNSQHFSRWFEDFVCQESLGPRAANLSAAKHRFASFAKPMGRMLLHLRSFFRVLHKISSLRDDAAWARKWLENVSAHMLLLLALGADAADSLLQLTRFLDQESCDPAMLNQEIGYFLNEIQVQFLHGKAWEISGYTKHVVEILESGTLYSLSRGQGLQLQINAGVKDKALKDFQPWVRLCEATVRAEFPDFEVFNSMLVFNLTDNATTKPSPQETSAALRRIALAFNVDPAALRHEWESVRPIAEAQTRLSQLDNREAWKAAYMHTQKNSHVRKKYLLKNLPQALRAYACWTPSSSLGCK